MTRLTRHGPYNNLLIARWDFEYLGLPVADSRKSLIHAENY